MRSREGFVRAATTLAAAAACASCSSSGKPPLPYPMAPPVLVALDEPMRRDVLAVLDFVDARPDFERSPFDIDEHDIGGPYTATDRFFTFHGDERRLSADPSLGDDRRARVTGEAAFAWYRFPNPGAGGPSVAPLERALPDYLAIELQQRGVFARVVRASNPDQARAAGATLVLTGRVEHFGAMFAEAHDPFVVRPDDWVVYHLIAVAKYDCDVKNLADGSVLLHKECLGRNEDPQLLDQLEPYRGEQWRPIYELDATHLPDFAKHDMALHTQRSLESATASFVADLEHALSSPPPPPPPGPEKAAPAEPEPNPPPSDGGAPR